MIKIAASILSADFANLGAEVTSITKAGADIIHLDVMDGHFVPNLTFGPAIIKAIRKYTNLPFEAHLMITDPQNYLNQYHQAGANTIIIHYESTNISVIKNTLLEIKSLGMNAGISIKPETSYEVLLDLLPLIDLILVMTVNPGFGGQNFLIEQVSKIEAISLLIKQSPFKIELSIDGGINKQISEICVNAGANILIAGNFIFSGDYQQRISILRN